MRDNKINQKLLIPLFNVELGEPIKLSIDEDEFVEKLTAFIFPEPIQVYPKIEKKLDNEPVPTPIPIPKTTIHFYPWDSQGKIKHEISNILPLDQLPADFDIFDNLGIFAVRAGPGGLGGFQTHTQIKTKRHATIWWRFGQRIFTIAVCGGEENSELIKIAISSYLTSSLSKIRTWFRLNEKPDCDMIYLRSSCFGKIKKNEVFRSDCQKNNGYYQCSGWNGTRSKVS